MSCPDCFRGGQAKGSPKGTITTIHDTPTYIAAGTPTSQSTIIFFTDAFGLNLVNNKLLADAYASQTGFRVLVPDIIPGGGGITIEALTLLDEISAPVPWWDILGQLKRAWSLFRAMAIMLPFFYRAWPPSAFPICLAYTRKVKASLAPSAKLGVAGFCWGGNQTVKLSAEASVPGGDVALVDAQFCAHPSALKMPTQMVDAVVKFKVPFALAHAERDFGMAMKQVEEVEVVLREKVGRGEGEGGYFYEMKTYKGCAHGFAVRAKEGDEVNARGADEAKEQAVEWFKRWL